MIIIMLMFSLTVVYIIISLRVGSRIKQLLIPLNKNLLNYTPSLNETFFFFISNYFQFIYTFLSIIISLSPQF